LPFRQGRAYPAGPAPVNAADRFACYTVWTMNQTALVVLDSRRAPDRRLAENAVLAALDHFGVPWDLYELGAPEVASDFAAAAARDPMAPPGARKVVDRYAGDRALFILAHDGAGRMPAPMARLVADAVRAGAGLLSFDR